MALVESKLIESKIVKKNINISPDNLKNKIANNLNIEDIEKNQNINEEVDDITLTFDADELLSINYDENGLNQEDYEKIVLAKEKITKKDLDLVNKTLKEYEEKLDTLDKIKLQSSHFIRDYDENVNQEIIFIKNAIVNGEFDDDFKDDYSDLLEKYGWENIDGNRIVKIYKDIDVTTTNDKLSQYLRDMAHESNSYLEIMNSYKDALKDDFEYLPENITNEYIDGTIENLNYYSRMLRIEKRNKEHELLTTKYYEIENLENFKLHESELLDVAQSKTVGLDDSQIIKINSVEDKKYLKIYNYLKKYVSQEEADNYLNVIEDDLNQILGTKAAQRRIEQLIKSEDGETVEQNIINYLQEAGYGTKDGVHDFFEGFDKIDANGEMSIQDYEAMIYLEYLQSHSNQAGVYSTFQGVGHMLPTVAAGALVGVSCPAAAPYINSMLIGTSSYGTQKNQMLLEGYDYKSAVIYSALASGSDAILEVALGGIENIGVNAILNSTEEQAFKEFAKEFLLSMGQEGLEEIIQDTVSNGMIRSMVLGEKTDAEELLKTMPDTFIQSALVAGILNGGTATFNYGGRVINMSVQKLNEINQQNGSQGVIDYLNEYQELNQDIRKSEDFKSLISRRDDINLLVKYPEIYSFIKDNYQGNNISPLSQFLDVLNKENSKMFEDLILNLSDYDFELFIRTNENKYFYDNEEIYKRATQNKNFLNRLKNVNFTDQRQKDFLENSENIEKLKNMYIYELDTFISQNFSSDNIKLLLEKIEFENYSDADKTKIFNSILEKFSKEEQIELFEKYKINDSIINSSYDLDEILSKFKDKDYLYQLFTNSDYSKIFKYYDLFKYIQFLDSDNQMKLIEEKELLNYQHLYDVLISNVDVKVAEMLFEQYPNIKNNISNAYLNLYIKSNNEEYLKTFKEKINENKIDKYNTINLITDNKLYDKFSDAELENIFDNEVFKISNAIKKVNDENTKSRLINTLKKAVANKDIIKDYELSSITEYLNNDEIIDLLNKVDKVDYNTIKDLEENLDQEEFYKILDKCKLSTLINEVNNESVYNYLKNKIKKDNRLFKDMSSYFYIYQNNVELLLTLIEDIPAEDKVKFVNETTATNEKFAREMIDSVCYNPDLLKNMDSYSLACLIKLMNESERNIIYEYSNPNLLVGILNNIPQEERKTLLDSILKNQSELKSNSIEKLFNILDEYEYFMEKISYNPLEHTPIDSCEWYSDNDKFVAFIKNGNYTDYSYLTSFLSKLSADKYKLFVENAPNNVLIKTSIQNYNDSFSKQEIIKRFRENPNILIENDKDDNGELLYFCNDSFIGEINAKVTNILDSYKNPIVDYLYKDATLPQKLAFINAYNNENITTSKLLLIEQLKNKNKYLFNTLDYSLLSDDLYKLGPTMIEKLSKYPDVVKSLSKLKNDEGKFNLFKEIILQDEVADDLVTDSKMFKLLKYLNNHDINPELLKAKTPEEIALARNIILKEADAFSPYAMYSAANGYKEINNPNLIRIDDYTLDNYEQLFISKCDELMANAKTVDEAKNIIANRYFSMSIDDAQELNRMYGTNIAEVLEYCDDKTVQEYFSQLQTMLDNVTTLEEARKVYNEMQSFTMDDTLDVIHEAKKAYTRSILNELYDINSLGEPTDYADYNGKKIPIYDINGTFTMLIQSTKAYGKGLQIINDNYKDSWNLSDRTANHGICCSIITNENMGMANVDGDGILIGFFDFSDEQINMQSPYDIYTANDGYEITCTRSLTFTPGAEFANMTRHTHNELNLERVNLKGDGEYANIQPSYILIYDGMSQELLNNAYKASEDFGIPILRVDRTKLAAEQSQQIDTLMSQYQDTKDVKLVEQILLKHENNRSGYRASDRFQETNYISTYFPTDKINNLLLEAIENGSVEDLQYLKQVLLKEQAKFDTTQEATNRVNECDIDLEEFIEQIDNKLNGVVKEIPTDLELKSIIDEENNIQFEKSDLGKLSEDIANSQYSKEQVLAMLNNGEYSSKLVDIQNEILDEYKHLSKAHGARHITDVVTYAYLVGSQNLDNAHDIDLLLQAAKYHDIGRTNDDKTAHAIPSAEIAIKKLKGVYSDEDLAMIASAIEFHEVDRNKSDTDAKFNEIASKYNVKDLEKARQLAEMLKDADALDRTRFVNNARLDPSLLKYDTSKLLIKFSSELQESYALEDLKKYGHEDLVQELLKKYTPQELLRTIRKSGNDITKLKI